MKKAPVLIALILLASLYLPAQGLITVAGTGNSGYNGDNIPAVTAELNNPTGVAVDAHGNVYVTDADNHRVRKIDTAGVITTFAGTGAYGNTGDDSAAINATLGYPIAVVFDRTGNLYFADLAFGTVRRIDTAGIITNLLNGLSGPSGLAFDGKGNLFITEQIGNIITKMDTLGNTSRIAGNDTIGDTGDHGPAIAAEIAHPYGIGFDAKGNLYFSEISNRVRRIDTAGIITTVAGAANDTAGYNGDGIPADTAWLSEPEGITFDKQGNLYIADGSNNRIRKVDTSGIITTYIGPGGYISDTIGFGSGVNIDAQGNMYLLDGTGFYVRELPHIPAPVAAFSAAPDTVCPGSPVHFTDHSAHLPSGWLWTFTGGTPDTSTLQDPTITYRAAGTYPVKLLVSNANGADSLTKNAYITVYTAPVPLLASADSIICSGDSTQVCTGDTFTASQAGNYYVTVTDANGCTAQSAHLAIATYPVPSVSIIVQGDTLSSFGQQSYQWIYNGTPIPGATGADYVALQHGSYSVQATDVNGCSNISSPVLVTGIADLLMAQELSIYPNPSVGNCQLTVDNSLVGSALEVYDEQGRLVFNSELRTQNSELSLNVARGVYYLRISNEEGSVVRKLVKL